MNKHLTTLFFKLLILVSMFTFIEAAPIRIMPLGDSLTYGVQDEETEASINHNRTGYRAPLWYSLKDAKYEADFVGSMSTGASANPPFDTNHEGHPNWTSYDLNEKLYGYLEHAQPNIILLHIGTNDHSSKINGLVSILDTIDRYEQASGQQIQVIVAKVIQRSRRDLTIDGYNHNLEIIVKRRWTNGDKLTLVNMAEAKLNINDYANNTHLNHSGYNKMASVWFNALMKPYVPFSTAPFTKDDKIEAQTGTTVSINVLTNDKDYQNDMNINSIRFVGGSSTLSVSGQGTWSANKDGIVTFKPNSSFYSDPTPVQYTVKDAEGTESAPSTITINYSNASLGTFPTTVVSEPYIDSVSIDESTNSVTFITRVPNTGIKF
jgi:lysophospholipase L1-like esterase